MFLIFSDPVNVLAKDRPQRPIAFGPELESNELNHACEKSIWMQKQKIMFEQDLVSRNIVAEKDSPEFLHARLFETTNDIVTKAADAALTLDATKELVKE